MSAWAPKANPRNSLNIRPPRSSSEFAAVCVWRPAHASCRRHRHRFADPLGQGAEITWKAILEGKSGAGRITTFDPTDYACQVACEVPRVDGRGGGGEDVPGSFNPDDTLAPKDQRRVDDFILYAIAAADEAVKDLGWVPESEEDKERTGVIIGSGIGGLATIEKTSVELFEKGPRRVSPFFIPSALINLGVWSGLDPSRLQGAEPLGRHRLRHRRPRDRRRCASDQVRRR